MKYDYIIVGGGSAGCVLANRLSADPAISVLLLEAGRSDRSRLVDSTLGFAYLVGNPDYDWCFQYGPEPGLGSRRFDCPRGKVLGGSSSINAMFYVRGLASDFDHWAAQGHRDWAWEEVEPWFRKIEDYAGPGGAMRGRGGPVAVTPNPAWHPLSERMLQGAEQAGIGRVGDYNAEACPRGIGRGQLYLKNGKRCGAAQAYLRPCLQRKNLTVITEALVKKILFSGKSANGVVFTSGGREQTATAEAEVILSAGSVGTPQLLECSGVGDGERLQQLSVSVVKNLPAVGEHMRDHFLVPVVRRVVNTTSFNQETKGLRAVKNFLQYTLFNKGYFAGSPSQVGGHAMVSTSDGEEPIQFIGMPCSFTRGSGRGQAVVMEREPGVTLSFYPGRPRSTGYVHITSPDIGQAPQIIANFLSHPTDEEVTVAGLRACRSVFEQSAFDGIRGEEAGPGPDAQSDEQLLAYARKAGNSAYHVVGSSRMGRGDRDAVVDQRLRVFGIDRLRIVDASVIPALISANTHAVTVVIAERAAQWILESRRSQSVVTETVPELPA